MPQNQPISRLATAMGTLALAFAPTCLHADSLGFTQTNLVSDIPGLAANTDPNLKNPWGVAFSATSPFWTSDQGHRTRHSLQRRRSPPGTGCHHPRSAAPPTGPTGRYSATSPDNFLSGATAATFIFDTLNGTISGWNGGSRHHSGRWPPRPARSTPASREAVQWHREPSSTRPIRHRVAALMYSIRPGRRPPYPAISPTRTCRQVSSPSTSRTSEATST